MVYQKFAPHTTLSPFVECYYIWESETLDQSPFEVESPPNAFTSIVFNYGDEYYVSSGDTEKKRTPGQFIVGQQTYSYTLHLIGKIGMAGIVFKPTGIASIFKIDMFALTRERIDLRVFISSEVVQNIMLEIITSSTAKERADILERFLFGFLGKNQPEPDIIDRVANQIVEKNGQVNINELCAGIYLSRRQFERKFLSKVGVSPKYYARLRRISYICSRMAGKEAVNWQLLYNSCDYYDQSHFIRDFIEFTGRSPAVYMHSNIELIHHVKSRH